MERISFFFYPFIHVTHNHLGTERISFFHPPNDSTIHEWSPSASFLLQVTHNHSEMECISFFFAPSDSQSFRNGAYQFLLCSKSLTTIQLWSASVSFLLQMTHNHSEKERISFFFARNDSMIQKRSASASSLLKMTHNDLEIEYISLLLTPSEPKERISLFFAPSDSQPFRNGAYLFFLCSK